MQDVATKTKEKTSKEGSIAKFCERYGIGRTTFYNMRLRGEAPDVLTIGTRVIITPEAIAKWEKAHTAKTAIQ